MSQHLGQFTFYINDLFGLNHTLNNQGFTGLCKARMPRTFMLQPDVPELM